jgi:hypothetical protein
MALGAARSLWLPRCGAFGAGRVAQTDVLFAGLQHWLTVLQNALAAELPQRTP